MGGRGNRAARQAVQPWPDMKEGADRQVVPPSRLVCAYLTILMILDKRLTPGGDGLFFRLPDLANPVKDECSDHLLNLANTARLRRVVILPTGRPARSGASGRGGVGWV
jgi:hypothetical protein